MDNVFFLLYCFYLYTLRVACAKFGAFASLIELRNTMVYTLCMGIDTRPAHVMSVWICSGAGSNLKVEGHKMQAPKNFDVPLHLVPFQVRLQARIRPRDESLPSSLTIAVLLIFLTTQTGLSCMGAGARGEQGGQAPTLEKIWVGMAHPGNFSRGLKTSWR